MLTVPNELALTESRTMRAATADRTDVLDKVKALVLLPDDVHATTELVAGYYEVDIEAINSLVKRNRAELEENGLRKLEGAALRQFAVADSAITNQLSSRTRSLRLFTRRTMLNVGQLLVESEVARRVRTYLLDVEESATATQKASAIEKAAEAEAQLRAVEVLARIDGNTSIAAVEAMAVEGQAAGLAP